MNPSRSIHLQKILFGIVIGGSLIFLNGCNKKFLDVAPIGQQTSSTFFANSADAQKAVTSCYGHLNEWKVAAFANLAITSITSDDAEKGSVPGDAAFMNDFDNFTATSTEGQLSDFWNGQYQNINLCNQVLDNIPLISTEKDTKNFCPVFFAGNSAEAFSKCF